MTALISLACRITIAVCMEILDHLHPEHPDFAKWADELATPDYTPGDFDE